MPIRREDIQRILQRYMEERQREIPSLVPHELLDVGAEDKPYLLRLLLSHPMFNDPCTSWVGFELMEKLFSRHDFAQPKIRETAVELIPRLLERLKCGTLDQWKSIETFLGANPEIAVGIIKPLKHFFCDSSLGSSEQRCAARIIARAAVSKTEECHRTLEFYHSLSDSAAICCRNLVTEILSVRRDLAMGFCSEIEHLLSQGGEKMKRGIFELEQAVSANPEVGELAVDLIRRFNLHKIPAGWAMKLVLNILNKLATDKPALVVGLADILSPLSTSESLLERAIATPLAQALIFFPESRAEGVNLLKRVLADREMHSEGLVDYEMLYETVAADPEMLEYFANLIVPPVPVESAMQLLSYSTSLYKKLAGSQPERGRDIIRCLRQIAESRNEFSNPEYTKKLFEVWEHVAANPDLLKDAADALEPLFFRTYVHGYAIQTFARLATFTVNPELTGIFVDKLVRLFNDALYEGWIARSNVAVPAIYGLTEIAAATPALKDPVARHIEPLLDKLISIIASEPHKKPSACYELYTRMRQLAILALAQTPQQSGVDVLFRAIEASPVRSLEQNLRSLALTGNPRVIDYLISKCKDSKFVVEARYAIRQLLDGSLYEKFKDDQRISRNILEGMRHCCLRRADAIKAVHPEYHASELMLFASKELPPELFGLILRQLSPGDIWSLAGVSQGALPVATRELDVRLELMRISGRQAAEAQPAPATAAAVAAPRPTQVQTDRGCYTIL